METTNKTVHTLITKKETWNTSSQPCIFPELSCSPKILLRQKQFNNVISHVNSEIQLERQFAPICNNHNRTQNTTKHWVSPSGAYMLLGDASGFQEQNPISSPKKIP